MKCGETLTNSNSTLKEEASIASSPTESNGIWKGSYNQRVTASDHIWNLEFGNYNFVCCDLFLLLLWPFLSVLYDYTE